VISALFTPKEHWLPQYSFVAQDCRTWLPPDWSFQENGFFDERQINSLLETRPPERKHSDCDISILRLFAPNKNKAKVVVF
jgi:hypothetical protein